MAVLCSNESATGSSSQGRRPHVGTDVDRLGDEQKRAAGRAEWLENLPYPGKREGRSQGDLPAVQESWLWENGAGMRWVFGRAGQHTEKSRWWKQALR